MLYNKNKIKVGEQGLSPEIPAKVASFCVAKNYEHFMVGFFVF